MEEQVLQAKRLVSSKIKDGKKIRYIAYFQNFTSTYGDEDSLLKKYIAATGFEDVAGLSVGTRPDCISEKMLGYLAGLSKKKISQRGAWISVFKRRVCKIYAPYV